MMTFQDFLAVPLMPYFQESEYFITETEKVIKIKEILIDIADFGEKLGACAISIFEQEGMAPHFHVSDGKDFNICVCLYHPYWYVHFGKLYGRSDITPDFGQMINNLLKRPDRNNPGFTYWDSMCRIWWNVADSEELLEDFDFEHCKDLAMPDYSKLEIFPDFEPDDDPWCIDEKHIGTIDLSGDIGECDVIAFPEIGVIPHVHIISKDRTTYNLCVCVYDSKFFYHDESHKFVVTDEHKKIIDEWFKADIDSKFTSEISRIKANWRCASNFWYFINESFDKPAEEITHPNEQPDYTSMEELSRGDIFIHGF